MKKLRLGDPLDETTEICPVSNERQYKHVTHMVECAEKTAGSRAISNELPDSNGYFVAPTILTGLSPQDDPVQQEIFGPVVSSLSFTDEESAIIIANDTNFGLTGAVWTADIGRAHRVAAAVRAGTFWINSYKAIHVSSLFGGSRSSGFRRSSGSDALMEYTTLKSVWIDTAEAPNIAFWLCTQPR